MRIALISDIHGNLVSLDAVLADIRQQHVDQIICLGDVATLGPQPKEAISRLRELACPCIMGNHDAFLLDPQLIQAYMDAPWFADSVKWCINQLSPEDFHFVRSFEPFIEVPLAARAPLLCFHGSPKSNTDLLLATTPPPALDQILAGYQATAMIGGHTHVQMMRRHKDLLVINPGSVGMPFEQARFDKAPRFLPWAEYAIVSWSDGHLDVGLRQIKVNLNEVKQAAMASEMPDAKEWVSNWIAP
ncbi:MAG: metallophosphoesterase family protein [Anaerolineae bacterium]